MGSGDSHHGVDEQLRADALRLSANAPESWQLADRQLCDSVLDVSAEITRLEARRVWLVAEVDARCKMDVLGYRSTKMWLACNTLLEVGAAGRLIALGATLRDHPEVGAALDAGGISIAHAGLIVRFCEKPPTGMPAEALSACRDALLGAATGPTATSDGVRAVISKLEHIFESDTPPPAEDTERNEFHASRTLNGRMSVKGDLDVVTGEMLLAALSGLSKPRPASDGTPDSRTPARRRADGFTELLRRYLASGIGPVEGGQKPHISVTVKAADLAEHRAPDGRADAARSERSSYEDLFTDPDRDHVGWTSWMGPLTVNTARLLSCDCLLSTVVVDVHGAPLDLGDTMRTVTGKQRRALVARDRGCAFPNCGAPASWCEGHHIKHWSDHGPTNMDNLVLLCGFHHRLLHHSAWEIRMGADRHPWFLPPPRFGVRPEPLPSNHRAHTTRDGPHDNRAGPNAA
ncbi:MAG: DUF222 domain-containing protein [Rhodococcus sp.]|nr:DUF222 domain-containing protein [Rhodococcus sp. (in: high G+C Gram-positive bacteria)]